MEEKIYSKVSSLLDFGPLGRYDCGKLCRKRCCSGGPGEGMFLLPGEEAFLRRQSWCKLERKTDPLTGASLFFLACSGICPREARPLACRTFPLFPVLTETGELKMLLDRRGILVCPLVQADELELLHPAFRRRAWRAWKLLLRDPLLRDLVEKASAAMQRSEPWEKLFKMR